MRQFRAAMPGISIVAKKFCEKVGEGFEGINYATSFPLALPIDSASSGNPRRSFDIDNLTGLRSGNHVLEVGVLVDRRARIVALFSFALHAALLFVLLLLFTGLLSAAFFQLVSLGLAHDLTDRVGCVTCPGSRSLNDRVRAHAGA